ncbi:MAG: glycosyltransferase, partial [Chitinivibrionales bacterium]|nr:glycosyltransferase [Chitinivibrionales bacterium]
MIRRAAMKKADMHCHTLHSAHPSEWFLQRLGTRESYTTPEELYRSAKDAGMDFVTITDHNQLDGVLELKQRHPDDVFTGVEVTAYFPEDGCKIHVLVYGLDQAQFRVIDERRHNIYQLSEYIHSQNLAHSVAHATFSINGRLTLAHLEQLFVLFDCFEGINGARPFIGNDTLCRVLSALDRCTIEELAARHKLPLYGNEPWRKGLSAGSDDHSDLFIGRTYTSVADAATPEEFLERFKARESLPHGRHNDYQSFAYSIYKIAYEFSKTRSSAFPSTVLSTINGLLFDGNSLGMRNRLAITRIKMSRSAENELPRLVSALMEEFGRLRDAAPEDKIHSVYSNLADISDHLTRSILDGVGQGLGNGDFVKLIRNVSGLIPVVFMSLPFLTTINVLYDSRELLYELEERFGKGRHRRLRKILWFTDTLTDLNGPSETIRKLAWMSHEDELELIPVTCLLEHEKSMTLPPQTIDLPNIWTFTASFFETYTLRVPSLLHSIRAICEQDPDEILISTPGPVGLLALLAARLLHIPCCAIYHTDFSAQAKQIIGDEQMCRVIDDYVRWFYALCGNVKVPTREYIDILGKRGYNTARMGIFKRGIEGDLFKPLPEARASVQQRYGVRDGYTLLYAGRISKEKNMDMLADIYRRLREQRDDINLVLAGDGPYFDEFRDTMQAFDRVHFVGRVPREKLPELYSAADLFVFPSTTDTFGMVVLEAQACGLPALVTDIGGPKEVLLPGKTGYVAESDNPDAWVTRILALRKMRDDTPEQHARLRDEARRHVLSTYDWQAVLEDLFGLAPDGGTDEPRDVTPNARKELS